MRLFALLAFLCGAAPGMAADWGLETLYRLDRLPVFKPAVRVGSVSSYDRTGGNDDGFSGKYSFLRKEGDELVLADLQGPGVIYRIWTPTPTGDPVRIYFDGEKLPRIEAPFRSLFTGEFPPFVAPLVGLGAGGFYSYLPLPYRKSCRVAIRAAKLQFYQINYATYPADTPIETFDPRAADPHRDKARRFLASTGQDLSAAAAPAGARLTTVRNAVKLEAGVPKDVFQWSKPGRIVGLRIRPAAALAGKGRGVVLRMFWDGDPNPAVEAPAGDFFGYAWGQPAMRSLPAGAADGVCYFYLPMPFDRSARIEMLSEDREVDLQVEVVVAGAARQAGEGRFYAVWRRQNPTTPGQPFPFLNAAGRGHVVGFILQAQGSESGHTPFFEGDDQTTIDGALAVHGTGSEDFFNGGWYDVPGRWESPVSLPLSGCLGYWKHLSRTGGYRFLFSDAYSFRQSISSTIEHGPVNNSDLTDYVSITFLYADAPPDRPPLPPLSARGVSDFDRIVFSPGWSIPLHSFSLQNATLSKASERVGGKPVRYLSVRTEKQDNFGPHHVAFVCDVPARGRWRVLVEAMTGPEQCPVQLFRHEQAVGQAADFRSTARALSGARELAVLELEEGDNTLFIKLLPAEGQVVSRFEPVHLILERLR